MTTSGGGNRPQILIDLQVNVANFLASVQQGLQQGLAAVQNFAGQAQQVLSNAFGGQVVNQFQQQAAALNQTLQQSQAQFATLTSGAQTYRQAVAAMQAPVNQLMQAQTSINAIMAASGVSWKNAALQAISAGQATVGAVMQIATATGQTAPNVNQVSAALGLLGANANLAAQGIQPLTTGTQQANTALNQTAPAANNAGNAFDFLTNRIKAVVTSLIIVQGLYQMIQAFKDLTAQSQEEAQTQYELGAAVDFANKTSNQNIGTLTQWEAQIAKTAAQFKVFTNEDITQATTKMLELGGQLQLTTDQMQKLTDIAAALAEKHGKDLTSTMTELINAIAGGRLQALKDLGVEVRTTDLNVEAFNQGLVGSVTGMSDAQRAQVVLTAVMKDYNEQVSSAAGYLGDMAGQMKAADAQAANSKEKIATDLADLNLLFKNLYANFLDWISNVADKFKPLKDFINQFNNQSQLNRTIGGPPTLEGLGVNVPSAEFNPIAAGAAASINQDIASGSLQKLIDDLKQYASVLSLTAEQQVALFNAAAAYAGQLQKVNDLQNEQTRMGEHLPGAATTPYTSGSPNQGTTVTGALSDNEAKAVTDAQKKIDDLFATERDKLSKAEETYWDGFNKAVSDHAKKALENQQKLIDDLAKLAKDTGYKIADAQTKLGQDLVDLQTTEDQQLADAQDKHQKDQIKNKKDYYDALKRLDEQFYFDIFDAVANNDAIAILQAERKNNLEKDKLKDKYNTDSQTTDQNYADEIAKIKLQTQRRADELKLRYDRELEQFAIDQERRREQLVADNAKEQKLIDDNYKAQLDSLKQSWDDQKLKIQMETNAAYDKLTADLKKSLGAHSDYFVQLKSYWDAYYKYLIDLQATNQGVVGVPPLPTGLQPPQNPPGTCRPGYEWDDMINKCVWSGNTSFSVTNPSTVTNSTNTGTTTTTKIVISSDGTVSQATIDAIVKQLGDAIQSIIVTKGG